MAKRRMFSSDILQSAKYLKMPPTTRDLYIYLCINADDDGVVEAYNVLNLIKATEDDLKILIAKGYIAILDKEDLVTYIVDWRIHNQLRKDRKTDSHYKELLLKVIPDVELLERADRSDLKNKKKRKNMLTEYTEGDQWTTNGQPMDNQRTTNGQPMDNQRTAQYSIDKYSIDKDSVDKDSVGKKSVEEKQTNFQEIVDLYNTCFQGIISFDNGLTDEDNERIKNLLINYDRAEIRKVFEFVAFQKSDGKLPNFIPYFRTLIKLNIFRNYHHKMQNLKHSNKSNINFENLEKDIIVN